MGHKKVAFFFEEYKRVNSFIAEFIKVIPLYFSGFFLSYSFSILLESFLCWVFYWGEILVLCKVGVLLIWGVHLVSRLDLEIYNSSIFRLFLSLPGSWSRTPLYFLHLHCSDTHIFNKFLLTWQSPMRKAGNEVKLFRSDKDI